MCDDLTHAWKTIPCDEDLVFVMELRKEIWQLREQLAAANSRVAELEAECRDSNEIIESINKANDILQAENRRMREALTWYADPRNEESGELASQALKGGA